MFRRGEIYWARLDLATGSEMRGDHPVLIIQNNVGNEYSPTTIVAAVITSKVKKAYPFHVEIGSAESGLSSDSTVLLEQIRTLNKTRFIQKVGSLSASRMIEIDRAIKYSLGL